jgi:hypothetical protein
VSQQRAQGNIRVDGFAVTVGDSRRLDFPRAEVEGLRGEAGSIEYGAGDLSFDRLSGRLQGVDWSTEAASAGRFWVSDKQGRFEMRVARVELPHGMRVTQSASGGVELMAPHASLADVKLHIPDLAALRRPLDEAAEADAATSSTALAVAADGPPEPPPLRQERLRFLDAVTGSIAFTIKIVLDLPVLGSRTLDQTVTLDITDGSFDYRKLDDGLSWLEGAFLDIGLDDNRLRIGYGARLLGTREIISWALDKDASAVAAFNRIPLRSLADFRLAGRPAGRRGTSNPDPPRGRLQSLWVGDLAIDLHMVAPRNLEAAGGTIRFGGDDAPGIVDLNIEGSVVQPGSGVLRARAGAVDLTLKDIRAGLLATADRLHVGPMDELEVTFDGFTPRSLTASLHRVTATNLSLILGGQDAPSTDR